MATVDRRQRTKEQRRNRIINAAERVFFARGVEAATVDEIADVAEVSKGLVYVYFQSKEDLYNAVCFRALRMLRQTFLRAVGRYETGMEQIRAVGYTYVTFARRFPSYYGAVVYQLAQEASREPGSYAAACEAERDKIFGLVADAIRKGILDGTIRDDLEPLQAAVMLWAQMHGITQVAVMKNIQDSYHINFDELMRFSFGFVTDALKPQEEFTRA